MGGSRFPFPNMVEETSHMDVMFLGKGVKFLLDGFPILAVLHGLYEEGTEFWVISRDGLENLGHVAAVGVQGFAENISDLAFQ